MTAASTAPMHSRPVFDLTTQRHIAYWAAKKVSDLKADAIVVCGHSGLVLAGAVGMLAHVPVFAVRKRGERECSVAASSNVTGHKEDGKAQRWVWIDDFFSSGSTLAWSAAECYREGMVESMLPVAALLYRDTQDHTRKVDEYVFRLLQSAAHRVNYPHKLYHPRDKFPCLGYRTAAEGLVAPQL
jgi:Adenine/guanine phosphoribosyltransferases and related PRPP-binding proteins